MAKLISIVLLFLFLYNFYFAQIILPKLVGDNMVLQRDKPIKIWGKAGSNEKITIFFNNNTYKTKANKNGDFKLVLPSMKYGGPYNMTLTGKNKIEIKNILIGDVWICSGQSNMEWSFWATSTAKEYEKKSINNNIRIFQQERHINTIPQTEVFKGKWQIADYKSIQNFSGVGFYFGEQLIQHTNIPIGLIQAAWGGTIIESWIGAEEFNDNNEVKNLKNKTTDELNKELKIKFDKWYNDFLKKDIGIVNNEFEWAKITYPINDWKNIKLPGMWEQSGIEDLKDVDGAVWFAFEFDLNELPKNECLLSLGPIDDGDKTWLNGKWVGETFFQYNKPRLYKIQKDNFKIGKNRLVVRVEDFLLGGGFWGKAEDMFLQINDTKIDLAQNWKFKIGSKIVNENIPVIELSPNAYPTLLYNGLIRPLQEINAKGAIWYQGESNATNAEAYKNYFVQLVNNWRKNWGNEFAFYAVQLANYMSPSAMPLNSNWANLRNAQQSILKLPYTGLITAIDAGEEKDIHPKNKKIIGYRLATVVAQDIYGIKNLESRSPIYKSHTINHNNAIIEFETFGDSLVTNNKFDFVNEFATSEDGINFEWAFAKIIDKNKVLVQTVNGKKITAIRYAWSDNPDKINLTNSFKWPALPFSSLDILK